MNVPASINLDSPGSLRAGEVALPGWSPQGRVLIVGNDAPGLERQGQLLGSLGYAPVISHDVLNALRQIASDSSIGIVMVDLRMAELDGLFLLNEISERFMALRPIVTIAVGETDADLTIDVMRSGASDLLIKPLAAQAMSQSLRRATARLSRLAQQFQFASFGGGAVEGSANSARQLPAVPSEPSFADLHRLGAKIIKSRHSRSEYLSEKLLNEANWGILLDLVVAGLKGEKVATSSACAAAQVPLSTALRHVNQLIQEGWVRRVNDPGDKRRTFLELHPRYFDVMVAYLRAAWHVFGATPERHSTPR